MTEKSSINFEPLVSILITNYNYASYLASAIESALHQHYPAVEVIVVDDGSTDNSRDVINCYRERILPVFKKNEGQASAMNAGFYQSHGEIVIFLDADDMLLPDTVQRVVDAFRENPEAAKIMYRLEVVDAHGKPTGELKPYAHLPMYNGDLQKHILAFPFDMVWMATSGNSFTAAVLKQILPIPEKEYPILPDYYLSLLTPLFGSVVFLQEVGAYYRVHGHNNHESGQEFDLKKIRRGLRYATTTWFYIQKFAEKLKLEGCPARGSELLSVSSISERLVSLKLSPKDHPIPNDSSWGLFRLGVTASRQRFDITGLMRFCFILWFAALALAPPRVAHQLAALFFLPNQRQLLNRFLRVINRKLL